VVHLEGVIPLDLPKGDGALSVPLPALSAPVAKVEVRLILPGGRSYELAEKARAGQIGAPPGTAARKAVSGLGAQANAQINSGLTFSTQEGAPALFNVPPGFASLQASWSALSAAPPPLAVRVEKEKEKREWF
jgi:hypothetical protein